MFGKKEKQAIARLPPQHQALLNDGALAVTQSEEQWAELFRSLATPHPDIHRHRLPPRLMDVVVPIIRVLSEDASATSGIGVRLDDTDLEHFETIIRWNMAKSHFEITYQIEEDADVLREVVALVTSIVTDGDGGNLTFSFGENPQGHAFSGYDALVHLAMQFRFANQPISDGTFQFRPVFFSQVARSMGFIDTGLIVET